MPLTIIKREHNKIYVSPDTSDLALAIQALILHCLKRQITIDKIIANAKPIYSSIKPKIHHI